MKIVREEKNSLYRVYGAGEREAYDEYYWAESAQKAVDEIRDWHKDEKYEVVEVSKVVRNWR